MNPGDFGGGILRRLPATGLLLYQPSGRLLLPEEQLPGLYISGRSESSASRVVFQFQKSIERRGCKKREFRSILK
jgi:hypothetical protein